MQLAALLCKVKILALSTEEIQERFSKAQRVFGRQETFTVEDKDVMLTNQKPSWI